MTDVFQIVKSSVPIIEAAQFYGLYINKHKKALCPFHADTNPSLSFKGNYFKCFTCNAGGDVITLVTKLLNITPLEAAKRLNYDFNLHLDIGAGFTPETKRNISTHRLKRDIAKEFDEWDRLSYITVSSYLRLLRQWRIEYKPKNIEDTPHPLFIESLTEFERTQFLCNILTFGSREEKQDFYMNYRNEVSKINDRLQRYRSSKAG